MEELKENPILEFKTNTLKKLRSLYNLDGPGRMAESIKLLEEWVKKQEHFKKRDFDQNFLERVIILNKGSLERSKDRLDRMFTIKTLMPQYYGSFSFLDETDDMLPCIDTILPKMAADYQRVFISKPTASKPMPNNILYYTQKMFSLLHYEMKHDYISGAILIIDHMDSKISDLIANLDYDQFRQVITALMESFGTSLKAVHILSPYQFMETIITLVRPFMPKKITERITIHNSIESLHNVIPREILPVEYGGTEISNRDIYDNITKAISSDEHMQYMKTMCEIGVDESKRRSDRFKETYLGMPGSFRSLVVD